MTIVPLRSRGFLHRRGAHSQPVTAASQATSISLVGPAVPVEGGKLAFTFYFLFFFFFMQAKPQALAANLLEGAEAD